VIGNLGDAKTKKSLLERAHRIFVASYENPEHPSIQAAKGLLERLHLLQLQQPSPKSDAKGDSKTSTSVTATNTNSPDAFFAETAGSNFSTNAVSATTVPSPAKKKTGPCSRIEKCTIS